jgi:hypothetical protein
VIPIKQIFLLFVGFVILSLTRVSFIIVNYIPLSGDYLIFNRSIAELSVAIAVIPYTLILLGLYFLYKDVVYFIEGKGDGNEK